MWQPIETAPQGERIKVKGTGWTATAVLFADGSYQAENLRVVGAGTVGREHMTHWMPLDGVHEGYSQGGVSIGRLTVAK
jgi:hypothetical protein